MQGYPGEPDMRYDLLRAEGNAAQAQGRPVTDVIFDFGNVLLNWDPGAALVPRYDRDTIARFLDNEISGFYDVDDMVDEGGSVDDALAMVREQHGEQWAEVIRYYYDHTQDSLAGPIPGARMLIRDLKDAGIGVWGLSNWQKESFPQAEQQFAALRELDGKVVSGLVSMRKPQRRIYELALSTFGIDACTSVFVDDKAMNIVGANEAGIRGIRFSDPYRLRAVLIDLGLDIPAIASVQ
ncbi:MAG: HAD family phosphatase [Bifidobacterium tibiigranuli]|uniref:HAD family hydrolase n=1 Tax=Bifidobacterium tibiigranuli TaxID=2172043 RepID=UPI002353AEF2|nr:HAD family phosphatase [Bifidobacterium tibiigranuli]MCH4188816.1 HAD family phosphatase [Bifidobacterium tibiigranuli]MCH4203279.1 HAD family phosphatase [Bifidobacterium tibiigranuli]MCH4273512.1 HAD family phosphatase [Bifidobacterium tibiigranuli]MCI1790626.1 HAD family phosphatase [Bifidobacterium tibiigranuli]